MAWSLMKGEAFSPHFPRKIDAEAVIQAQERPESISRLSHLPKPEKVLDYPSFEDEDYSEEGRNRKNIRTRNWLAEQDRPVENHPIHPPKNSLVWNDSTRPHDDNWELARFEDVPIKGDDTRWNEGITEETVGGWGNWPGKLAQAQKYAEFYRQGYRPPPLKGVVNFPRDEWKIDILDGHHRGVMANELGLESLLGRIALTAKTDEGYTRGITPKDLEMYYELAGDAI